MTLTHRAPLTPMTVEPSRTRVRRSGAPGRRLGGLVLAGVVSAALTLSGCATAPGTPVVPVSQDQPTDNCEGANAPLSSLTLIQSPRTATGGATACLEGNAVSVVDNDSAPVLPATVTDSEGREVVISDISRILPLDVSGTIAATVFGLGLGDNVVGRDTSTNFDGTGDLPVVTKTGHTITAEAILELEPTVLLTDTTIGPKEVRQQLRDAGVAVVMISSERRIDSNDDLVAEVAAALGVTERGTALAKSLSAEIAAATAEVAAIAPTEASERVRLVFLYVRGNANIYYIFGADSGADSLIEALGATDVATEIGWVGMKPMTAEALVAAQPDALVMMTDGLTSVGGIDGLLERIPALAQTPAGRNARVIDMADSEILSFGPRTAQIVRALAKALYASPGMDAAAGTGE